MEKVSVFVGLDVHKDSIAVAVAEDGRQGEVRFLGNISSAPGVLDKILQRIRSRYASIEIAYEAGPTGYGLYRSLTAKGFACKVVAPSHTPKRPGNRIKNDTRDAMMLARLLRAGELTAIWVPDEVHEAMRDLTRARQSASYDVRKAKVPNVGCARLLPAQTMSIVRTKLLGPTPDRLVRNNDPARQQHFLAQTQAKRKPEIEPNRMGD